MSHKTLLLSIRPQYAEKIFTGKKTVELRKVRPSVQEGDLVLVYVSSPVKALCGSFIVDRVVSKSPAKLWEQVRLSAGISKAEFEAYYEGRELGFGIFLKAATSVSEPISLTNLRKTWANFHPPQSYRYLSDHEVEAVLL